MEQGRIMEAEAPTDREGVTPTGLTVPPPPQPLQGFLQAGCPSCRPTNSVKALKALIILLILSNRHNNITIHKSSRGPKKQQNTRYCISCYRNHAYYQASHVHIPVLYSARHLANLLQSSAFPVIFFKSQQDIFIDHVHKHKI